MATAQGNPLLSITKPSESPPSIKLHPLVLLTITDFITRHTLTERQGPIAGAVIGQQNGREIAMEHAFESAVESKSSEDGSIRILLSEPWFGERLAQYKEVHASPQLDLVAAFTLGSSKGPAPEHVPLVQQLKAQYNDDLLFILFHPETVLDGSLTGGKLPITIYETLYEPGTEHADKGLQQDGFGIGRQLQLKFRPLPFEVETGEAEMIAVDYVAKGAANANIAVENASQKKVNMMSDSSSANTRGLLAGSTTRDEAEDDVLTPEDDELIASLTSKANAIKMLQSRIKLIKTYLTSLPPSYLTNSSLAAPIQPGTSSTSDPPSDTDPAAAQINHTLLRQIAALVSRLPLLAPPLPPSSSSPSPFPRGQAPSSTTAAERQGGGAISEADDVALTSLLASLTRTIASAGAMSQKSGIVSRSRHDRRMAGLAREGGPEGAGAGAGQEGGSSSSFGAGRRRGGGAFSGTNGGNGGGGGGSGGGDGFEGSGFDSGADAGEDY